jgi:hypothetical protein
VRKNGFRQRLNVLYRVQCKIMYKPDLLFRMTVHSPMSTKDTGIVT